MTLLSAWCKYKTNKLVVFDVPYPLLIIRVHHLASGSAHCLSFDAVLITVAVMGCPADGYS